MLKCGDDQHIKHDWPMYSTVPIISFITSHTQRYSAVLHSAQPLDHNTILVYKGAANTLRIDVLLRSSGESIYVTDNRAANIQHCLAAAAGAVLNNLMKTC